MEDVLEVYTRPRDPSRPLVCLDQQATCRRNAPAEARRIAERFEWHYTPKHGGRLNLAESEPGVISSQCLDRRIPDRKTLADEIAAWEADRNRYNSKADRLSDSSDWDIR